MPAKVIFNLLIGIFGILTVVGVIIGINSVVNIWHTEYSDKLARIASWLFFGGGMACVICVAIRITLGVVT